MYFSVKALGLITSTTTCPPPKKKKKRNQAYMGLARSLVPYTSMGKLFLNYRKLSEELLKLQSDLSKGLPALKMAWDETKEDQTSESCQEAEKVQCFCSVTSFTETMKSCKTVLGVCFSFLNGQNKVQQKYISS